MANEIATPAVEISDIEETVLSPEGDLVAAVLPHLRTQLRKIVGDGTRQLTLDFSSVRMVDSAGLGLLISTHNSLSKVGGRLSVINASRQIFDLFRSMRVHQHFHVSEGR